MHFRKEYELFGLLLVFAVVTITSSSFGIRSTYLIYLDWKCNINFNYTLLLEDLDHSVLREKYISCYNNTIDRMDHDNFTINERLDCFLKCSQIANAELDEVSEKFHPNITDLIKDQYEKYSDAAPTYVKKVAKLMKKCATQATLPDMPCRTIFPEQQIKQSMENGTKARECEINGHYEQCWWESLDEYNISDEEKINKLCLRSG